MMDMVALFFKQNNDIVVTARYAEISDGTGMEAHFVTKPSRDTSDADPSVQTYISDVVADPDNLGATLSQFNVPSEDTDQTGAFWWRVDVLDTFGNIRTANCGTLLVEAV